MRLCDSAGHPVGARVVVEVLEQGLAFVLHLLYGVQVTGDMGEAFELYQQEALGDALRGADELELGDFIDEVDQVQALDTILVTLMHGIDAHVAGLALLQTVRLAR